VASDTYQMPCRGPWRPSRRSCRAERVGSAPRAWTVPRAKICREECDEAPGRSRPVSELCAPLSGTRTSWLARAAREANSHWAVELEWFRGFSFMWWLWWYLVKSSSLCRCYYLLTKGKLTKADSFSTERFKLNVATPFLPSSGRYPHHYLPPFVKMCSEWPASTTSAQRLSFRSQPVGH
jgi:hypothetical protein